MAELDVPNLMAQAQELQRAGQHSESESIYSEILLADQTNADAWHMLGLLYGLQGRVEMGIFFIQHAIYHNDAKATFYSNLGECYRVQKKWDEAIEAYRRAIHLDAAHYPSRHNLSIAFFELRRFAEAEECCRRALEIKPDMVESLNIRGNIYFAQRQFDQAEEYYHKALALKPDYAAPEKIWRNWPKSGDRLWFLVKIPAWVLAIFDGAKSRIH